MKAKLLKLNLPEKVVDGILDIFNEYQQTLKRYNKPKGRIALQDHLTKIEFLSKKLKTSLDNLSDFEKQLLNPYLSPKVFQLKTGLILLALSCRKLKKTETRFSKKEPFLIRLTIDLWKLLERHGIAVKKYKNNVLCQILDILLPEAEKPRKHKEKDKSEIPADLWSFNLLRKASEYFHKK